MFQSVEFAQRENAQRKNWIIEFKFSYFASSFYLFIYLFIFREQQDETFGETFKQEERHGDKRPAEQFSHQSAITQKETHKGETCIWHSIRTFKL